MARRAARAIAVRPSPSRRPRSGRARSVSCFERDAAGAQQDGPRPSGRARSIRARPGRAAVEDQRRLDRRAPPRHARAVGRADPAGAVGRWGGDRATGRAQQRLRDRMGRRPQRHRVEPGARQQRQRRCPARRGNTRVSGPGQNRSAASAGALVERSPALSASARSGHMHDQRVEARPALGREDARDRASFVASPPSPYTVSVGNATSSPSRSSLRGLAIASVAWRDDPGCHRQRDCDRRPQPGQPGNRFQPGLRTSPRCAARTPPRRRGAARVGSGRGRRRPGLITYWKSGCSCHHGVSWSR